MDWPTKETIAIWCTNSVMAAFLLVTIIGICRVIRYVLSKTFFIIFVLNGAANDYLCF